MTNPLSRLNQLLYTADMVGGQDMAQDRDLWFLFLLAVPKCGNFSAAIPFLDLGIMKVDPRVFM